MTTQQIQEVSLEQQDQTEVDPSRILVLLHPNPDYMAIVLSDRTFNREQYTHTRSKPAIGAEKKLLDYLNDCIVGIEKAQASKNQIRIELSPGTLAKEYVPLVVRAVIEWGRAADAAYEPTIYCEDQRWEVEPTYSEDGWSSHGGVKMRKGKVNLGMPYKIWLNGG